MSESSWNRHCRHGHADVETRSAASARKLVSALWQLNKGDAAFEEEVQRGVENKAASFLGRTTGHGQRMPPGGVVCQTHAPEIARETNPQHPPY